jgi:threonine/homoserine/homoserine lactone efflux protein
MSARTKTLMTKKQELEAKEKAIKAELETISTEAENKTKKVLLITAAVLGVAVIGYLGYRALTKKEEDTDADDNQSKRKSRGSNFGASILEKIIAASIPFITAKIEQFISKSKDTEES